MTRGRLLLVLPPIALAVILLLVVSGDRVSAATWVAIAGVALAYVGQIVALFSAPRSHDGLLHAGSMGLAVGFALLGTIVVAVVALIFPGFSWRWVAATDVAILAVAAFRGAAASLLIERDTRLGQRTRRDVANIRLLATTLRAHSAGLTDARVRSKTERTAEDLQMSPVEGTAASAAVESSIQDLISRLGVEVDSGDEEAAGRTIDRLAAQVARRSEIIKATL